MKLKFKILDPRIGKNFEIPKYKIKKADPLGESVIFKKWLILSLNYWNAQFALKNSKARECYPANIHFVLNLVLRELWI